MNKFPFYKQYDQMDCGPTCLRMIAKYYGKSFTLQYLRNLSHIDRQGVSLLGISDAADQIGLRTKAYRISFKLLEDLNTPFIAHWNQNHFVVVYQITKSKVYVADPGKGKITYSHEEFLKHWVSSKKNDIEVGVVLEVEPSPAFYEQDEVKDKKGFGFLFQYLRPYKKLIFQLILGLFVGSLLQLIFPFLTQSIVDYGISNQDISFIYLILIAQLILFISQSSVEVIRSWILLHIGTRVNISLISDFLIKLLKLPLGFFDTKMIGDILQRVQDHHRIEQFLTASSLNALFSIFNVVVFGLVLLFYSKIVFLIFFIATVCYFIWVLIFLKRRALIDHDRFKQLSENQSHLIQLINGVHDIKLNNSENQKRWAWEHIQARLFKVNIKALSLEQWQGIGAKAINQLKNILIIFFAATAVVNGSLTLGMMIAIQYIVGQLNSPIDQLIGFIRTAQDAKISLERLSEIHEQENEENPNEAKVNSIPSVADLSLENLNFWYGSQRLPKALDDISLAIPQGKTTAIVGTSGSGKTTLIKLLLKFYEGTNGNIRLGDINLKNVSTPYWRSKCGVVMQEGYIFSDTIANNIAIGAEIIDKERLLHAVKVANIQQHIESMPLTYNTKIGDEGIGLSAGQKQRLLIARAVYKNPDFLFFDEATNALDANNEKIIMNNLTEFFKGKTVVVVAHRLSTVKNADQIIVLEKGKLIEQGSHESLVAEKGAYFELVKNQLELGN